MPWKGKRSIPVFIFFFQGKMQQSTWQAGSDWFMRAVLSSATKEAGCFIHTILARVCITSFSTFPSIGRGVIVTRISGDRSQ